MSHAKISGSRHFCILPWVHVRVNQDANVYPCCRIEEFYPYGSLGEKSLPQIWNGEALKSMRKALLNDEVLKSCQDCHRIESLGGESMRQRTNREYADHFGRVDKTGPDGELEENALVFLDLRLSNLCNFRCRTCNPTNSTSWYHDAEEFAGSLVPEKKLIPGTALQLVKGNLGTLRKIYFAGGEPLLHTEHYQILRFLIESARTDVELEYNSNFSVLEFKGEKVTGLWKHFTRVKVGASLDGVREQGEFLRKGMDWDQITENFAALKRETPHVHFMVAPTLNVMNAFHITEALLDFHRLGMIKTGDDLALNLLIQPAYLGLQVLNTAERASLKAHYLDFLKKFRGVAGDSLYGRTEAELKRALADLQLAEYNPAERARFRAFMLKLDKIRNEKTALLFPELFDLVMG